MPSKKYALPGFLIDRCSPQRYYDWLEGRALAHVHRDRERGHHAATREAYMVAIHSAVLNSEGIDHYTGEALDWEAIGTWDNDKSKENRNYKKSFWRLPTVDHFGEDLTANAFKICAWRTNDCKNDLSHDQFVEFCRTVLSHVEKLGQASPKRTSKRSPKRRAQK
jgi:hypothetical protein